ncbi:MAG TPA: hypothetical protein VGL72_00890, partial [Bryobacteraceae bacterium]
EYGFSSTDSGSFGLQIQNGYRGPVAGRRLRIFSMGPIPDSVLAPYTPTFVMPSSGTVVIESVTNSIQASTSGSSTANSTSFKTGTIPPVLTAGIGADESGVGLARCFVDLPASQPIAFTAGDIITLLEVPQKLGMGLWQIYVWQLVVPYTSGLPGNLLTFTFNGISGSGPITINGLHVNDVIVSLRRVSPATDYHTAFASPITTLNTLSQTDAADLSGFTFVMQISR